MISEIMTYEIVFTIIIIIIQYLKNINIDDISNIL